MYAAVMDQSCRKQGRARDVLPVAVNTQRLL